MATNKTQEQMIPAANFIAKRLAPYLATGLERDDIAPVIAEALADLTKITSAIRTVRGSGTTLAGEASTENAQEQRAKI